MNFLTQESFSWSYNLTRSRTGQRASNVCTVKSDCTPERPAWQCAICEILEGSFD